MADKQLFDGHKYTFNKVSGSLILLDSTDNSHETITFREGTQVSGSYPVDIKPDSSGRGIRLYAHNANTLCGTFITYNNDDGYLSINRGGTSAITLNGSAATNVNTIYAKSSGNSGNYYVAKLQNSDSMNVLLARDDGKVLTYGGDLRVHGSDDSDDYLRLHVTGDNSYIDFKGDGTSYSNFLQIRDNTTERITIVNHDSTNSSYNYGMRFRNNDFDHSSQEYGFYFLNSGTSPSATNYTMYIRNDGASQKSRGILLQAGEDTIDSTGDTYFMKGLDGNGTDVFYVTCNPSGVTTWGAFTGAHYGKVVQSDSPSAAIKETEAHTEDNDSVHSSEYTTGTIVVSVKGEITDNCDQAMHYFVSSSMFQDKRVLGVYGSPMNSNPKDVYVTDESGSQKLSEKAEEPHRHQVWSLGDGVIIVCSQNGNIEVGDYITTASGSGGYGCKQNDDILHNYTVAKSLEDVDWSTESESTKKIACTIHCG